MSRDRAGGGGVVTRARAGDRPPCGGCDTVPGHGPLLAFTSLAMAGAGLVAAAACVDAAHRHDVLPALVTGVALQAIGLAISLGHLGQRRRAGLAIRGAGRSALSHEVVAAPLALACGALAAGAGTWAHPAVAVTVVAGATNALFLVSIGLVYRLRGQKTWQGASAVIPLTGGCAFGAIVIHSVSLAGGVSAGALLLIALDAAVFTKRWREVAALRLPAGQLAGHWMARRDQLLGARLFLLDVVPFFLLLAWPTPPAALVAAAGLLVDRFGFYALAVQHTTEREVGAAEDLIASVRTARVG